MTESTRKKPWHTVTGLVCMAVAMFGFGYLLVPLYEKFCEITGIGGRTPDTAAYEAELTGEVDYSRTVRVMFDATVNSALPWRFEPTERYMDVHPGKLYETMYIAYNRASQPVVAQAVPSVAPGRAALFFNKTECFCFTEQLLGPGESRDMPVRFVVDPNLPARTDLVTLSYIIYKNDQATAVLAAVD
ncbi:MAG: cytochrome c oxidase assembly protein [Wenzhouxiangella sp.]|nr:cytochrome c oxidase assembly protein [Wenzhouxiangella sp.]